MLKIILKGIHPMNQRFFQILYLELSQNHISYPLTACIATPPQPPQLTTIWPKDRFDIFSPFGNAFNVLLKALLWVILWARSFDTCFTALPLRVNSTFNSGSIRLRTSRVFSCSFSVNFTVFVPLRALTTWTNSPATADEILSESSWILA